MRQLKITQSITKRDSITLDKYLQEIGKEDLITAEEEVELAKKIKDNEATALKLLGAIETLQYLNPAPPEPTEVEETAEVPAA